MAGRDRRVLVSMIIGLIVALWSSWFVKSGRPISSLELVLFVSLFLVVAVNISTYIASFFRNYFRGR